MSLFEKARLVTVGTAHDLLDKFIDLNSPTVVRQSVRDYETGVRELSNEIAVQQGELPGLKREVAGIQLKIDTLSATVKTLQNSANASDPNVVTVIRQKAQTILALNGQLTSANQRVDAQNAEIATLKTTLDRMNAKHDDLVVRLHELERLDMDTKAKAHAATAIQNASQIFNSTDTSSVDNLAERMRHKNDIANAQFEQANATFAAPEVETNSADVDALLATLK